MDGGLIKLLKRLSIMTDEQKQIAEQAIRGAMAFGTGIVSACRAAFELQGIEYDEAMDSEIFDGPENGRV